MKPNYINNLLAMQAINYSKQRIEADRLYNLIKEDPFIMNEGQIQTGRVYMYAVAIGDIPYAENTCYYYYSSTSYQSINCSYDHEFISITVNEDKGYFFL
jgi:hypothetical protein